MIQDPGRSVSNWRGIRHARIIRSMFDLPGVAFRIYAALRYILPDGAGDLITVRELAEIAGVSPGSISPALRTIAENHLITVSKLDSGELYIRMLAPQELRSEAPPIQRALTDEDADIPHQEAVPALTDSDEPLPTTPRSGNDRGAGPSSALRRDVQPAPSTVRSASDRHPYMTHENQQQQMATPSTNHFSSNQHELLEFLQSIGTIAPLTAIRIVEQNPDRTGEDFRRDLAYAESRPNVRSPLGLVLHVWNQKNSIYVPPRDSAPARAGNQRRARNTQPNLIQPTPNVAEIGRRQATVTERVAAIAPSHFNDLDRSELWILLDDGIAEQEALARVEALRAKGAR